MSKIKKEKKIDIEKRKKILMNYFGSTYISKIEDIENGFKIVFDKSKILWVNDNCLINKIINKKEELFDISQYLDKGSRDTITISNSKILSGTINGKKVIF